MKYKSLYIAAAATFLFLTGCSKSAEESTAQNLASDPANGNLAPADQSAPPPQQVAQYAPAPAPPRQPVYSREPDQQSYPAEANYDRSSENYAQNTQPYETASYDRQVIEAPQPPPPLPEYSQPECPGDNYIWTPGYWSYASAGYYWVPGVWVVAPYVRALWTPPYWEAYGGRYRWHHGYWGEHIGFYGGISYGFGYTGRGYEGGYWNGSHFDYNRSVNNVNVSRVHNVYNYTVVNNTTVNNRISYNGGQGGINVRASAPELAVLHEQRMPPVAAQVQHMRQAAQDRSQFANANQGRPAVVVAAQPLATEYRQPAARLPAQPAPTRPAEPVTQNQNQPPAARRDMRSEVDMRNQVRQVPENQPAPPVTGERQRPMQENRPAPQQNPAPMPMERGRPMQENRPAPAPAASAPPVFRPAPQAVPEPPRQPQGRMIQNERQQNQPVPQAPIRPAPENRPAPVARPAPMQEQRQQVPQARPEPPHAAAPPAQGRPEGRPSPPPGSREEKKEERGR